jgi:hypothetical protein
MLPREFSGVINSARDADVFFTSAKTNFDISMRGTGQVELYVEGKFYDKVELKPEEDVILTVAVADEK